MIAPIPPASIWSASVDYLGKLATASSLTMFKSTRVVRAFAATRPALSAPALPPFQPHPHSLPVDGFIGAIGNTPLVRLQSGFHLAFEPARLSGLTPASARLPPPPS